MIYKNGDLVVNGDLISWMTYDSDDNTTWTFRGIFKDDHVIYMGGGIDFGSAIGATLHIDEVMRESECNDPDDRGITKVCGSALEFSNYIAAYKRAIL
jgi:hypothetical protein